jgi:GNAT superfamily N-acetyltransferase
MSDFASRDTDVAVRALAWTRRPQELICDRVEPWEHGKVYRMSRYPTYFDFNTVRVRDDPKMDVEALIGFADQALAGLEHRRLDFDSGQVAEPLRAEFHARGFKSTRLVWMRFEGRRPDIAEIPVAEVSYDTVSDLRIAWHQEDFPGREDSDYHAHSREVRLALGIRTLAVHEHARPVAFASLNLGDDEIEIGALYVLPEYRGQGRGTALIQTAITAAGDVEHLWICADDEDRPKQLYARLGFRPVLTTTEFLRLPPAGGRVPRPTERSLRRS